MDPIIIASILVALGLIVAAAIVSVVIFSRRSAVPQLPQGRQQDVSIEYPDSEEGIPVEPSGIALQPETPVRRGSTVLAFSQGRWWRARVVSLEGKHLVRIHYPGWDSKWDESVPRSELQVDISESLE